LRAAALAYPSRPGAARCRTRSHRDKGNDAGFTINLPTSHDKSSYLGTVRSSRRSGRRPAAGLGVRSCTDHPDRHSIGRPAQRPDRRTYGGYLRVTACQRQLHSVAGFQGRRRGTPSLSGAAPTVCAAWSRTGHRTRR